MLKDQRQIYTISLVLTGDFNPTIIQPFWLSQKKLIGEQDASGAKLGLIHKDLVRFETDWFNLEVNKVRFEVRTSKEPYFEPLRDLLLGIFEYLKETPITSLGINHIMHVPIQNEEQNERLGNNLASLQTFGQFMTKPKVFELAIVEEKRIDELPGNYTVRLTASDQTNAKRGLAININDHYGLEPDKPGRNGEIIKSLADNWRGSFTRADDVVENIWSKFVS